MSQPQVLEDEKGTEAEFAHHFGAGLSGLLKGFEDAHRKAAKAGDVFGAEAGSDAIYFQHRLSRQKSRLKSHSGGRGGGSYRLFNPAPPEAPLLHQ